MEKLKNPIELLLTQKYHPNISLFTSKKAGMRHFILDIENDTMFTLSDRSLYVFMDRNQNVWLAVPESYTFNAVRNYPVIGTQCIQSNGLKHTFVTPEVLVAMAKGYFEKFVDKNYGIDKKSSYLLFFYDGDQYNGEFHRFRYRTYNEIDAFISHN